MTTNLITVDCAAAQDFHTSSRVRSSKQVAGPRACSDDHLHYACDARLMIACGLTSAHHASCRTLSNQQTVSPTSKSCTPSWTRAGMATGHFPHLSSECVSKVTKLGDLVTADEKATARHGSAEQFSFCHSGCSRNAYSQTNRTKTNDIWENGIQLRTLLPR